MLTEVNDRLRERYGAAWPARDWPAIRAALAEFHAARKPWLCAAHYNHGDAAVICRNARGEPHPPRWRIVHLSRPTRGQRRERGFAAHIAAEKALREGMANLAALPGFDPRDLRPLIPVKVFNGRRYVIRRGELMNPLSGRFLHPINPKGQEMRGRSIFRTDVTAIIQERRAAR
jgi:hypothetical protein